MSNTADPKRNMAEPPPALSPEWRALCESSEAELRAFRLWANPLPRSSLRENLRKYLRAAEWNALRRAVYARANYRCERCGAGGASPDKSSEIAEGGRLDANEHWSYDYERGRQVLERLEAVCRPCHDCIHGDFDGREVASLAPHWVGVNKLADGDLGTRFGAHVAAARALRGYKERLAEWAIVLRDGTPIRDVTLTVAYRTLMSAEPPPIVHIAAEQIEPERLTLKVADEGRWSAVVCYREGRALGSAEPGERGEILAVSPSLLVIDLPELDSGYRGLIWLTKVNQHAVSVWLNGASGNLRERCLAWDEVIRRELARIRQTTGELHYRGFASPDKKRISSAYLSIGLRSNKALHADTMIYWPNGNMVRWSDVAALKQLEGREFRFRAAIAQQLALGVDGTFYLNSTATELRITSIDEPPFVHPLLALQGGNDAAEESAETANSRAPTRGPDLAAPTVAPLACESEAPQLVTPPISADSAFLVAILGRAIRRCYLHPVTGAVVFAPFDEPTRTAIARRWGCLSAKSSVAPEVAAAIIARLDWSRPWFDGRFVSLRATRAAASPGARVIVGHMLLPAAEFEWSVVCPAGVTFGHVVEAAYRLKADKYDWRNERLACVEVDYPSVGGELVLRLGFSGRFSAHQPH